MPRRLDHMTDPSFLDGLQSKPLDELQSMKRDCGEVETELSYVRRLAQGRIEIIAAEQERRLSGASLSELVAALPQILSKGAVRPDRARSYLPTYLAPSDAIQWSRGREQLIRDASLSQLTELPDMKLVELLDGLRVLEQEASKKRRQLHSVIDVLNDELQRRRG